MTQPMDVGTGALVPRRRRPAVLVVALVALVVFVAIGVTVVLLTGTGATAYRIVTPSQAGGLQRNGNPDTLPPSSAGYRNLQKILGAAPANTVSALYRSPDGLLFTVQAATGDFGDPGGLLGRMRASPPQGGGSILTITTRWEQLGATDPGPHGGRAACGQVLFGADARPSLLSSVHLTVCAWQTRHTVAMLTATIPQTMTPPRLADIMRRMRPDLERPA